MKKIILIVLVFTYASSYGQTKDDCKVMIDSAIAMQKVVYLPNIYLIDEKDQPYLLSAEELRKKFKYISLYETQNKKLLKQGINAWKIIPSLNGNRFTVNILDFLITYSKNNYAFKNGGGATVIFEYSCDSNKWILLENKWSGI